MKRCVHSEISLPCAAERFTINKKPWVTSTSYGDSQFRKCPFARAIWFGCSLSFTIEVFLTDSFTYWWDWLVHQQQVGKLLHLYKASCYGGFGWLEMKKLSIIKGQTTKNWSSAFGKNILSRPTLQRKIIWFADIIVDRLKTTMLFLACKWGLIVDLLQWSGW